MDDMVELRCKYCGAPFDRAQIESDSQFVTCASCGTSQQRVDAKKYMEQMMGQIQSWISKAIPGGFSLTQQENVDPIARHNIYMSSVKPSLDIEIRDYRFALTSAASAPLIVLPFNEGTPATYKHTSTQAFEFNARLKSIEPLAVDSENKTSVTEAEAISSAYAMIINNSKLLSEKTPGRFAIMSNNFKEASAGLAKCKGMEPLAERLEALSEVCTASDMVLNGDQLGCSTKAEKAISMLEKAKKSVLLNPKLAMTIRAMDIEISQSKTLKGAADGAMSGGTKDALGTLELINSISSVNYPVVSGWEMLHGKKEREKELISNVEGIVTARGSGTLPICTGAGDTLYPFWDVDLRYSFTTGSLFGKKAVEVEEDILIPATFTLSASALKNPACALTDIFALGGGSTFKDRLTGNESSISGGKGIGRLTDSAAPASPGSRAVIVPLSTKAEAVKLVERYMQYASSTHSKLKLSNPAVKRLVYIPCTMEGTVPKLPSEFDGLYPWVLKEDSMSGIIKI